MSLPCHFDHVTSLLTKLRGLSVGHSTNPLRCSHVPVLSGPNLQHFVHTSIRALITLLGNYPLMGLSPTLNYEFPEAKNGCIRPCCSRPGLYWMFNTQKLTWMRSLWFRITEVHESGVVVVRGSVWCLSIICKSLPTHFPPFSLSCFLKSKPNLQISGFQLVVHFWSLPCSGMPNCSPLDPIHVLSPNKTAKEWSGYPDQRPAGALIAHNHEGLSGRYIHILPFIKH